MRTSEKKQVQFLVQSLVELGLKQVVISPGSRNAPLIIAFGEHPDVTCHLVHDERCAAFVALGMMTQDCTPVAVVCTSGSAVLNYFPAVAEAFYQGLPLLVISADRPKEFINQGQGQTIMQSEVFGRHVRGYLELDDSAFVPEEIPAQVAFLWGQATVGWTGPIHINFSFHEPLYDQVDIEESIFEGFKIGISPNGDASIEPNKMSELQAKWVKASKKLVLVGQMPVNDSLQIQLEQLSQDPSVVILVENLSNVAHHRFIHCIDRTIEQLSSVPGDFVPEVMLTMGGAVVSKRVKSLLANWSIREHWRIAFDFPEMDTYGHLTEHLAVKPESFVREINAWPWQEASDFSRSWKQLDYRRQELAKKYLETLEYCDLKAFELILDCIPEGSHVHFANSSVIRYAQLFDPIRSLKYYGNRGTSGIDGSLSTAVGAARANPNDMHVCITGDISMVYDSNALWNNFNLPNLRIILINNGGGGIFKIIPGPNTTNQLQDFFVASNRSVDYEKLTKSFGNSSYKKVDDESGLLAVMDGFWTYDPAGSFQVLEVDTTDVESEMFLRDYFQKLRL